MCYIYSFISLLFLSTAERQTICTLPIIKMDFFFKLACKVYLKKAKRKCCYIPKSKNWTRKKKHRTTETVWKGCSAQTVSPKLQLEQLSWWLETTVMFKLAAGKVLSASAYLNSVSITTGKEPCTCFKKQKIYFHIYQQFLPCESYKRSLKPLSSSGRD